MASFEKFDGESYAIDDTGRTITKKKNAVSDSERATAYGRIPMLCDNVRRGVHQYEIELLEEVFYTIIGIDEGRNHVQDAFMMKTNHHYALMHDGDFYDKQCTLIQFLFT